MKTAACTTPIPPASNRRPRTTNSMRSVSSDMSHTRIKKIRMPPRIAAAIDCPPLLATEWALPVKRVQDGYATIIVAWKKKPNLNPNADGGALNARFIGPDKYVSGMNKPGPPVEIRIELSEEQRQELRWLAREAIERLSACQRLQPMQPLAPWKPGSFPSPAGRPLPARPR